MNMRKIIEYLKKGWEYLTSIKWIFWASLFFGLALTCWADKIGVHRPWPSLMSNFGTALMIASIIGIFLEITEFKRYFEDRIVNILIKDDHIKSLNEDRLIELNLRTMKCIANLNISNLEYEYDDFVKKIQDGVLLENLGKIYRKDFQQIIHYSRLKKDEIQELGAIPDELNGKLFRIRTTTRFQLIAPNEDEEFDLDCGGDELTLIPGLDPSSQISFELWINDDKVDIDIAKHIKTNEKTLSFKFVHKVKFKAAASFTASIEYKKEKYLYDEPSGRINDSMNTLTHGANIHFSSREELEFVDAEFYGLTGYSKPAKTDNSISIDYSDWALPEDGYFIYWREKIRKS